MTAKEIQKNNDDTQEVALDVKVPATGVSVDAIISEVTPVEVSTNTEASPTATVADIKPVSSSKITPGRKMRDSARRGNRGGGDRRGRGSGRGETRERVKPEFDSKIIDIRRVTRVAAGGRRYTFSVAVVAGDRKGRVGVGLGKGGDTALAVEKATREAKKHLIKVPLSPQMTIPHATEAKYGSAYIMIFPARGRGVVAGSSARAVIELAGIRDISAKLLSGSKNRLNNARVTIAALEKLSKTPRSVVVTKK